MALYAPIVSTLCVGVGVGVRGWVGVGVWGRVWEGCGRDRGCDVRGEYRGGCLSCERWVSEFSCMCVCLDRRQTEELFKLHTNRGFLTKRGLYREPHSVCRLNKRISMLTSVV